MANVEEMLPVWEERKRGTWESGKVTIVKRSRVDFQGSTRAHLEWVAMALMWEQSIKLRGFSIQLCSDVQLLENDMK